MPAIPADRPPHAHPGWPPGLDPAGWTAPDRPSPREIAITEASAAELGPLGISLRGPPGPGNRILFDAETPPQRLNLDLSRAAGCTLLLGRAARLQGEVMMSGRGHLLSVAGGGARTHPMLSCQLLGESALVLLGAGVTCNRAMLQAEGPEGAILIGDDAMLSSGIVMRSADSHALIAIAERAQINLPAPILVRPHVWIGHGVTILKGVTIGTGSVLATQALVTRDVPPRCLAGGVPAGLLREGVTWSRRPRADAAEMERVLRDWGSAG